MSIGEKAKLINLLDTVQADKAAITPTYTIEMVLTKSPRQGVKCGAIAVFKMNDLDVDIASEHLAEKMKQAASELTQTMYQDPEYFKQTEGRWIPWAIDRCMELFDKLQSAEIVIKVPKLRIRHRLSRAEIASVRSDPRALFRVAFEADRLLDGDFGWDPWRSVARRGIIGADK